MVNACITTSCELPGQAFSLVGEKQVEPIFQTHLKLDFHVGTSRINGLRKRIPIASSTNLHLVVSLVYWGKGKKLFICGLLPSTLVNIESFTFQAYKDLTDA
jgi:hypothetical protein